MLAGAPTSTGATLTSATVSLIVALSLSDPSLTTTSKVYTPGPCASVGVQVKTPVVASMLAPVGAPLKLNVKVWAGRSGSVAEAVNVYGCSSSIVALAGTPLSTGGSFTAVTVRFWIWTV